MNNEFLSSITGRILNIGSLSDPQEKAGLARLATACYRYGTKDLHGDRFFTELENLGSILVNTELRGITILFTSQPKENSLAGKQILRKLVEEVNVTPDDLKKAVQKQKMDIDDLNSENRIFAGTKFMSNILSTTDSFGTHESLDNITLHDVNQYLENFKKESIEFTLKSPDSIEVVGVLPEPRLTNTDKTPERLIFLEKETEQKILIMGYKRAGFREYPYGLKSVARAILSDGAMGGLIWEEVRVKNSAAYFAGASERLYESKGTFYAVAGVSEENIFKCVEIINGIFHKVIEGDFDQSRIDLAKTVMKSALDSEMDSLDGAASFYAEYLGYGMKPPAYRDLVDEILAVNKEDIMKYYASMLSQSPCHLLVHGSISSQNKDKLSKLIND